MKRKITRILAALALLVFIAPSMVAWGQTSYTLTIDVSDFNSTSYAANNGSHSKNAVDVNNASNTLEIEWFSNQVMLQSNVMQWQKNNGYIYNITDLGTINSVTVNSTEGTFTTYYGSAQAPSTNTTVGGGFFQTKVGNATGKTTSIVISFTISGGTIPTCAAPTFSPVAGTYTEAQTISISCTTDGATIYYTTDGEDPTSESGVYTSSFTISETTTVKAMAVKEGMNNSGIVTAVYTIEAPAPVQTFSQIDGHNPVAGQTYLIVDLNTNKALTSANGTGSAPSAVAVAIENNQISTNNPDIQWTFEAVEGGYTIHPVGDNAKWLYTTTSSGNSVRVGTGSNKVWTLDITSSTQQYHGFKNNGSSFYLGVYNSQDWRGYSSINTNIENTQIALFVLGEAPAPTPYITANGVNIAYNATNGEITYTINNPDADATLTADITNSTIDNFALGTVGASSTTFTCGANTVTEPRTATVTLNYVKNGETLATKDVTVTQAAAPVIYTTIPDLFAAATSTSTPVTVTFGGWVVTGVNGNQVFVTDGTNGFIIYQSGHGFVVGNTLTGTASCNLVLFNGSAEITGLTTSTEGLTVGTDGTVTPVTATIDNLSAVNTGSVVTLNNLTYNGSVLSDGTNSITPYSTLYSGTFENGKTYNVTGVFVLNNTTKRILPRSAEDIEEVVLPVINADNVTIAYNATSGIIAYTIDNAVSGTNLTASSTANWISDITVGTESVNFNTTVNDGNSDRYATITLSYGTVTKDVTVTQGHLFVPATGNNYELFSGDLVEGEYLIVYNGKAMNNVVEGNRLQYVEVTANDNDVIVLENAEAIWHISPSGDYWTIYNAEANAYAAATGSKNQAQMLANGSDDKALWTVTGNETYDFENKARAVGSDPNNKWLRNNTTYGFACYGSSTGGALSLYKRTNAYTPTLAITGYGESTGGYVLIASPVSTTPAAAGMITDDGTDPENYSYDLYYYDETGGGSTGDGKEWRNYRAQSFELVPGKGYLYANKNDVTIAFTGELNPSFTDVTLPYTEGDFSKSIYLAGNSSTEAQTFYVYDNDLALQTVNFLTMNSNGDGFTTTTATSLIAEPMQGFFVQAAGSNWTLSTAELSNGNNSDQGVSLLNINVIRDRGNVIDNAIVSFSEGSMMNKFYLRDNTTRVYIPQGNEEMAVVRSAAEAEMPVSFKAAENGTYTLAVETENVEMNYLHLIDNMTGMDVDLLQTPSYTFEAKTNDYASRFRLVFSANSANEQNAETFAYFNGSNWTVSNLGEATLQVVDVTGRTVANQMINGNAELNLNQPAGVYVIRLVNGNSVRTQKIVVR